MSDASPAARSVSVTQIFGAFLVLGATSFGGGVLAYLRSTLVEKHRWIDDVEFVEILSISQSLPGLSSVNVAILTGDRLRGTAGALAAVAGLCIPGALVMFAVGMAYGAHKDRPAVSAALHGVAAVAVGLVSAVTIGIGKKALSRISDYVFLAMTVVGVHVLHLSVMVVLLVVGAIAVWWYRPR